MKKLVEEEVKAISIASVHFDCWVDLKTDEEVKTCCIALSLAKQWRIKQLDLSTNIGEDGWKALTKVAEMGEVGTVRVDKLVLREATEQQIRILWKATGALGCWKNYDNNSIIAKARKGEAGLQRLLALGGHQTQRGRRRRCRLQ